MPPAENNNPDKFNMITGRSLTSLFPPLGALRSVQVPDGYLQLAKVVANRIEGGTTPYTLVCWIDIRRDAEWLPSAFVPKEDNDKTGIEWLATLC